MFFERHRGGERVVLVHADQKSVAREEREDPQELLELATSAGAEVLELVRVPLVSANPATFIGSGRVEQLADQCRALEAELVILNHELSPTQERNLEKALSCRVIDRTGLILDIFASRAQTHEGKLQVELAQLQFLATRLVRGWTHLERQKGGIGLRGPGESQLETDRRLLRARVKSLEARLDQVRSQRANSRRARQRAGIPMVALVGYTNAGKSTLYNTLVEGKTYAADQLFATLDPKHGKLELGEGLACVLTDTVGFIRHLPHKLVEAFQATLEETVSADLILHVIDGSDEDRSLRTQQVHQVLKEIGASEVPLLEVVNKIDLTDEVKPRVQLAEEEGIPACVWVSAYDGQGIDLLLDAIRTRISSGQIHTTLFLAPHLAAFRADLHQAGAVLAENWDQEQQAWAVKIKLESSVFERIVRNRSVDVDSIKKA